MAINNVTFTFQEIVAYTKLNQLSADATNTTDNIHPQYALATSATGVTDGTFVLKAGDTMTGALTLQTANFVSGNTEAYIALALLTVTGKHGLHINSNVATFIGVTDSTTGDVGKVFIGSETNYLEITRDAGNAGVGIIIAAGGSMTYFGLEKAFYTGDGYFMKDSFTGNTYNVWMTNGQLSWTQI